MVHARERDVSALGRLQRIVPALAVLSCSVGFAFVIPRTGSWSTLLLLPLALGAGFVWGDRARSAKNREALERFKSRLSHELNNPLAILIDQLDALERVPVASGLRCPSELKSLTQDALEAASRIARVVRELDDRTRTGMERPAAIGSVPPSDVPARERPVPPSSGLVPKPTRARILVIDDEPQVAASLRRMLYRHDVTVATSGFEAQRLIRLQEFDVIVSDVMMPEPSGMDVFERLTRTNPELARRFVFVTGGTYTTQARDFLASIPNARLGKPVDALALDRAITEIHQGRDPGAPLGLHRA